MILCHVLLMTEKQSCMSKQYKMQKWKKGKYLPVHCQTGSTARVMGQVGLATGSNVKAKLPWTTQSRPAEAILFCVNM